MVTPAQCRAARALLEFSQGHLAVIAQVSEATIRNFETGRRRTGTNNLKAISSALELAGIEFVGESGVTLGRSDGSPTSNRPEVAPVKNIVSDPLLESLVRRATLSQINPNLRYEVHGANLTLTLILGRVQIKPGSDDLSLVEFQPTLEGKRDREDHRLTQYELIKFADQCYRRRDCP
jgi:transcriptional regulator with XRE-family HTH domain